MFYVFALIGLFLTTGWSYIAYFALTPDNILATILASMATFIVALIIINIILDNKTTEFMKLKRIEQIDNDTDNDIK